MLHPDGKCTDEEFEEYVVYAIEGRRRVKEQMNKRKPDDEFINIGLSYINTDDQEVEVHCPETIGVEATLNPIKPGYTSETPVEGESHKPEKVVVEPQFKDEEKVDAAPEQINNEENVLGEQHYTITYDSTGYSYESIIVPYLKGAKSVTIEDPYIRANHQIQNFIRFSEAILKQASVKEIILITSFDDSTDVKEMSERLDDVKQSLLELDVILDLKVNKHMHDREIRIDNGWTIKIGRGLDFFQKPDSWYGVGVNDLSLRKCLETKVDIYKS